LQTNPDNRWRAIATSADGASVQALSALTADSFAYAINDSGVIVGCRNRYDDIYPDPHQAFVYFEGTVTNLHDLLAQTPYDFSCARGVNRAGDVVGEVQSASAPQRGFVYRNGVAKRLETPTGYLVNARAINDLGKIAGEGRLVGFSADHALVYDVGTGAITSLAIEASGAYNSRSIDINGRGDVVGMMFTSIGERAFLASGGQVHDLNRLIQAGSEWVLQEGLSINDHGQIVGRGYRTSSPTVTSYFLATPLSPAQATEALIERVNALVALGALGKGPGHALVAKLQAAARQVSLGNFRAASQQLSAFINHVNAQIGSGQLAAHHGAELLDAAQALAAVLAGMR
jgi:probable HAF family extracellular repeat protein